MANKDLTIQAKQTSLRSFVLIRALLAVVMIVLLFTVLFAILYVIPGDPARVLLGPVAPPAMVQNVRQRLGLNRPLYVQYLSYLVNIFRGDFGTSFVTGEPVLQIVLYRFPATLELSIPSMTFAIIIGIFAGAYSGVRRNKPIDSVNRISSIIIYSVPIFWMGLMFQFVFGVYLHWLPVSGRISPTLVPERITGLFVVDSIIERNMPALISSIGHLILPVVTLGLYLSTIINRITRAHMVRVLNEDFIFAARALDFPKPQSCISTLSEMPWYQ